MAQAYIHIYINNPTSAGSDGTQVSEDGTQTSPLSVTLDASKGESKIVKCAIRCTTGYKTSGSTVLTFTGTTKAKWSICPDASYADATAAAAGTYSDTLTITDSIADKNVVFWVKAISSTDESPAKDTSVTLMTTATIVAA